MCGADEGGRGTIYGIEFSAASVYEYQARGLREKRASGAARMASAFSGEI